MPQRRSLTFWCALAAALVLMRAFVPVWFEGFYFDADQAIVGLMARHVAERKDSPLFYYGLNYLLAVQAWLMAPFFALGRPSVGLARLPLVLLNVGVAVWLVRRLARDEQLRPAFAFAAALPFIVPTPATATMLLEFAGASIEPFVYVLGLWALRRRPFAFGLLLAIGYLHREFVIFALPAIALVEMTTTAFWSRDTLRRGAWMAAGFALAWLVVDDLKLHLTGGSLIGQAQSLGGQMCWTPSDIAARATTLVTSAAPILYGARQMALAAVRINSPVVGGSSVVGVLVGVAAVAIAVLTLRSGPDATTSTGFAAYLTLVGVCTLAVYPLSCNIIPGGVPLMRYLMLPLLVGVGLTAMALRRATPRLQIGIVAVIGLWTASNLVDHARVITVALADPPGSEHRVLTNYLLEHRIRYARAIYWDAYVVDFLSNERVITASVDTFRIPDYQKQVDEHANVAVMLERLPCEGGTKVASWCVK